VRQNVDGVTITIDDLALLYLDYAKSYYVKNDEPTSEVICIRSALRLLVAFAGHTRCREFGPRQFRKFRDSLISEPDKRFKDEPVPTENSIRPDSR
jgi:hypothetical protein